MIADTPSLGNVDEDARRRFEVAWRLQRPEPIEHFLPSEDHSDYLATLEELVHIELEFTWKAAGAAADGTSTPTRVDDYLTRFRQLNRPDLVRRLLEQEYRVRQRYGDHPSYEEYGPRLNGLTDTSQVDTKPSRDRCALMDDLPRIPGYEVLGLLGRGGMGLVLKARQLNLNRLVALKLIGVGVSASGEELARFRIEAEAVARLQHPNIVQIHDVAEHNGSPYLALEYVDGGSLAQRLTGEPQPAHESAQIIEILARAMDYAHQRKIIHRDLKPANILLTRRHGDAETPGHGDVENQESVAASPCRPLSASLPKITDFGLAKRLDKDMDQTRTGAFLGTPTYMAPEQASGHAKTVGPAADVYALGAILYELLTGRPPFRGETPLETLEQTRSQEPLPPSRLRPKLPRDLETICLKCLQKEPRQRYGSAGALAADLALFLNNKPILARPVAPWERAWKWARRRPALAALLLVSMGAVLGVVAIVLVSIDKLRHERNLAEAQRQRAVGHLRKARDAVDRMLTRVGQERLSNIPQMEPVRQQLLEDALGFYKDFASQTDDDPEVRYETGRAYRRLGNLYILIGKVDLAESCHLEGIALLQRLSTAFPNESLYVRELASGRINLGLVLMRDAGRLAEAEGLMRQAQTDLESLQAGRPDDADCQADLAVAHNSLGNLLNRRDRHAEEEILYRKCAKIMEGLVARFPEIVDHQIRLIVARNNVCALLEDTERWAESEQLLRMNQRLLLELTSQHPAVADYHSKLALTGYHLGRLLARTGRGDDAVKVFRHALTLREKLSADFPSMPYHVYDVGELNAELAELAVQREDLEEARRLLERAVVHHEKAMHLASDSSNYQGPLRARHASLADVLLRLKDHAGAAQAIDRLTALTPVNGPEYWRAGDMMARSVQLAGEDLRLTEAQREELTKAYADRAVQLLRDAVAKGHKDLNALKTASAFEVLRSRGDFQQLVRELDEPRSKAP